MKKLDKLVLADFLEFFPEVDLPVTLTEDSSLEFSRINRPFTNKIIHKFILPIEDEVDDNTEFIPCFKIKDTLNFHALVYWKAGLMNYEFRLITIQPDGTLIDGKVIAGTLSNGETIIRTVSTIDTDWIIHTVVGEQAANTTQITTDSKAYSLELLGSGEIIFSLNEQLK